MATRNHRVTSKELQGLPLREKVELLRRGTISKEAWELALNERLQVMENLYTSGGPSDSKAVEAVMAKRIAFFKELVAAMEIQSQPERLASCLAFLLYIRESSKGPQMTKAEALRRLKNILGFTVSGSRQNQLHQLKRAERFIGEYLARAPAGAPAGVPRKKRR